MINSWTLWNSRRELAEGWVLLNSRLFSVFVHMPSCFQSFSALFQTVLFFSSIEIIKNCDLSRNIAKFLWISLNTFMSIFERFSQKRTFLDISKQYMKILQIKYIFTARKLSAMIKRIQIKAETIFSRSTQDFDHRWETLISFKTSTREKFKRHTSLFSIVSVSQKGFVLVQA